MFVSVLWLKNCSGIMNFDTRESYLEIDIGLRAKLTGVKDGDVRIRDHFQIFYGLKL